MRGLKAKNLVLFLGIVCCEMCFSQESYVESASETALAGATVSLRASEGLVNNPASIGFSSFTIGVNYSNRYLLGDLSGQSIFLVLPISESRFGLALERAGNEAFRNNHIVVGVAKSLAKGLSAGLNFHYYNLVMEESSFIPSLLTCALGLQWSSDRWGIGMNAFNFYSLQSDPQKYSWKLSSVYRIGIHRGFDEKLFILGQITYKDDSSWVVDCAMEYRVVERCVLRTGLKTESLTLAMGIGFFFGKFRTDFAFSYHEYLGFSPSVTILFCK